MATATKTIKSDSALMLQLDKSRWWALQNTPFYGTMAMGLTDHLADSFPVPEGCESTCCTDYKSITWTREYLARQSDEETRYLLLHETLHPAHGHGWRKPIDYWGNVAGDWEIEHTLRSIPGIKMPKGGLICPKEMEDKSFEEKYAYAQKLYPEGKESNSGFGGIGDYTTPADQSGDGKGKGDQPGEGAGSLKDEWERRVIQAGQVARARAQGKGDLPADLQSALARITAEAPIDWRRETADFLRNCVSGRNDWSRQARRHATAQTIHPRRKVNDMAIVVFVRDSSGSISADLAAEFTAHIVGGMAELHCQAIMIDCDCEVQAVHSLDNGELPTLEIKGHGGTAFQPALSYVSQLAENGDEIAGLVYLTDLENGGEELTAPEYPVLWLSTTDKVKVAPFGRTVRIK